MFRFGASRGGGLGDAARLFYHTAVKPTLVFRGKARYNSAEILEFSLRASPGQRFRVCARDNGLDVKTVAEFFSPQYEFIPPELPPMNPKVVYDLGANIGAASLYLAAHFRQARFFGFEPLPGNFEVCVRNFQNLPQSTVYPWAVGARSGPVSFDFSDADPRGGRVAGVSSSEGGPTPKRLEVELFSVEDLVNAKKLPPPDFLKIDVEGAEVDVLSGLGKHARAVDWMLVETHGTEPLAGCLRWMLDNGFVVRHVHEARIGQASIWCSRSPEASSVSVGSV